MKETLKTGSYLAMENLFMPVDLEMGKFISEIMSTAGAMVKVSFLSLMEEGTKETFPTADNMAMECYFLPMELLNLMENGIMDSVLYKKPPWPKF